MKPVILKNGPYKAQLIYGHGSSDDVLKQNPQLKYDCIITSPPYFNLRNYSDEKAEVGKNQTLDEYIENLVSIFRVARENLSDQGSLWLNVGDSYAGRTANRNRINGNHNVTKRTIPDGLKEKDLIGTPWRLAFALQADGWWLRNELIWQKPNPMPSSAQDRFTVAHEQIFLLTKKKDYYFNLDPLRTKILNPRRVDPRIATAPRDTGAQPRTVWKLKPNSFMGQHPAVFPEELPWRCMQAGCPEGGTVLDLFSGSGTTGKVAITNKRNYIGIDVNADYLPIAERRVSVLLSDYQLDENQPELFGA